MTGKRDAGAGAAWWQRQQRIVAAAKSAGVPRGAMALLRVLLEGETGRTQTVIRSRETLAEAMGAHIDTVDRNMKTLVAAGVVEKLYSKGGQHKANVYKLKEIGEYPPQNAVGSTEAETNLPQNTDLPPAKCGNTSRKMPPPSYPSYLSEGERRGAGRTAAGPNNGPLGAGGNCGASLKPVAPQDVRALLTGWGFDGREIDGFGHREVIALLRAEGFRLVG